MPARPEPDLVGHQHADAALVDAVYDQQRAPFGSGDQHVTRYGIRLDIAHPFAPLRVVQRRGDGVALAGPGQLGLEAPGTDDAGRGGGQHGGERRAREAGGARELLARDDQQRAAIGHISRHVGEVGLRDDALALILVEDDEVELGQLLLEQFLGREGDQRQFLGARIVGLERRAQNREVDEVHRRIGFQKVAPDAAGLVRLAGDQQHAQPVAHAGDGHRGAVVGEGQLFRPGCGLDDHHVLAAPLDLDGQGRVLARLDADALRRAAIQRDLQLHLAAARVFHAHDEVGTLADDAEVRRVDDPHAAIAPVLVAGDQAVQRSDQVLDKLRVRKVVDLAIGNEDRARDPVARHVGHQTFQRAVKVGAVIAGAGLQRAHFQRLVLGEPGRQRRIGGFGGFRAVAELHALGAVEDHGGDRGQRLALLVHKRRIEQRRRQQHEAQRARQPGPPPQCEIGQPGERGQSRDGPEERPAEERLETEADGLVHCGPPSGMRTGRRGSRALPSSSPKRSSKAGMCTWSSL